MRSCVLYNILCYLRWWTLYFWRERKITVRANALGTSMRTNKISDSRWLNLRQLIVTFTFIAQSGVNIVQRQIQVIDQFLYEYFIVLIFFPPKRKFFGNFFLNIEQKYSPKLFWTVSWAHRRPWCLERIFSIVFWSIQFPCHRHSVVPNG